MCVSISNFMNYALKHAKNYFLNGNEMTRKIQVVCLANSFYFLLFNRKILVQFFLNNFLIYGRKRDILSDIYNFA